MHEDNKVKQRKSNREENWIDDLLKRQEHDLEKEEEILSTVPQRIWHKYLEEDEE
ncbi:MAG: hypothetical protein HYY52_05175 [Candidatus Melainabacteria bacterium]|nr:hypothetical protein [Candidatus Melainabacteria bacterium]